MALCFSVKISLIMYTALACTLHDPHAGMLEQTRRALPQLLRIFPLIFIRASTATHPEISVVLQAAGVVVDGRPTPNGDGNALGLARAQAVKLAVEQAASHIFYCDYDRILHWVEHYPAELERTSRAVQEYDFCVLGRTERAWGTHPRVQRDTEAIINHAFRLVSGLDWDVGDGARGLSLRAARAILAGSHEENLSTDVSWPLFLRRHSAQEFENGYTQNCILTEGLEFETADRFAKEVRAAGGLEAWLEQFDADPRRWSERLELAAGHVRAMLAYAGGR